MYAKQKHIMDGKTARFLVSTPMAQVLMSKLFPVFVTTDLMVKKQKNLIPPPDMKCETFGI